MTNMTLALPEDLHSLMKKHDEVKWSAVARKALREHAEKLELMDKLLENSEVTEEFAIELGKRINQGIAKKHKS